MLTWLLNAFSWLVPITPVLHAIACNEGCEILNDGSDLSHRENGVEGYARYSNASSAFSGGEEISLLENSRGQTCGQTS